MTEKDVGGVTPRNKDEFLDQLGEFTILVDPDSGKYKAMRDYVILAREKIKVEDLRHSIMIGQREDSAIISRKKNSQLISSNMNVALLEANIEAMCEDTEYNQAYIFITSTIKGAETEEDPKIKEAITAFDTSMFMLFPFE